MSTAANPPTSRRDVRWFIAVGIVLTLGIASFHYRLAFTPDSVVARRIQRQLSGVRGLEAVKSRLASRYEVLASGLGDGSWFVRGPYSHISNATCIHIVVGEYRILLENSIEALIVLDQSGQVREVLVRRTIDAP